MMRRQFPRAAAMLLPLMLPAAALADAPAPMAMAAAAPVCTAPVAPAGALAPWAAPTALTASGDPGRLAPLAIGQAANLTLLPTPAVKYALRPEKPGGSVSYGGLIVISAPQAGIYRVALSSGAWIDVLKGGKALTSVAHGHGPDCTGVRKMVDFALQPGQYTIQIAASGTPAIKVLVALLP